MVGLPSLGSLDSLDVRKVWSAEVTLKDQSIDSMRVVSTNEGEPGGKSAKLS